MIRVKDRRPVSTPRWRLPSETRPDTPEGYRLTATLDLSTDRWALVGLNLAGLAFLRSMDGCSQVFFACCAPNSTCRRYYPIFFVNVVTLLVASGLVIFVHELVHGLFSGYISRDRPKFGFRGSYAYAAAPNWYIPRGPFVVIGLAPLVVITLAGLAAVMVFPPGAFRCCGLPLPGNQLVQWGISLSSVGCIFSRQRCSLMIRAIVFPCSCRLKPGNLSARCFAGESQGVSAFSVRNR